MTCICTISQAIAITSATVANIDENAQNKEIRGVISDSRKLKAGELFVVDCQDPAKRAYVGRFSDRLDWLDSETMRKCLQGDGPVRFGA